MPGLHSSALWSCRATFLESWIWKRGCCHCGIATKYFIFICTCQPSSDISGTSVESRSESSWDTAVLHCGIMLWQKRLPRNFPLASRRPSARKNYAFLKFSTPNWYSMLFTCFGFFPLSFCQGWQCVSGLDVGHGREKRTFPGPSPKVLPSLC